MEFSKPEYWSGLSFLSPGDLPDPGIEPGSLTMQADSLLSEPPGKPQPLGRFSSYLQAPTMHQALFFFLTLLILIMMSGDNFWYPHFSDKETDAQKAPRLAWSHILAALVLITMRGTIKRVAAQACESESSFLHLLTLSHPIAHTHHQVMPTPPLEYFLTPSNPFSLSRFQSQPTIISQSCLTLTLQGLNFFSAKWG